MRIELLALAAFTAQALGLGQTPKAGARAAAATSEHKKSLAIAQLDTAERAEVIRAGDGTKLQARAGDLLFAGDVLITGSRAVRFLYCPKGGPKVWQTLESNARASFEVSAVKAAVGRFAGREPARFCELPIVDLNPETNAKSVVIVSARGGVRVDSARLRPEDRPIMVGIDEALEKDPNNVVARTSRSVLLARNGFSSEAAREFAMIAKNRPDLPWAKELVQEAVAPKPVNPRVDAPTYAVVIGISQYGRPSAIPDLRYADRDARSFYNYLRSPRGGNLPEQNVKLLVNEQATNSAIKEYIQQFMGKPRSKLIVFLSGHGAVSNGQGYLITYRSDPANLRDSAYPMRSLTELMYGGSPGRVELYVDACRSGHIGTITERNAINRFLKSDSGTVFGILGSHEGEVAWEYQGLGEGHGAFTYFLLRALNSPELYGDGKLTIFDLTEYVKSKVRFVTLKKQNPQDETTSVDVNQPVAFVKDKGIPVEKWDGKAMPAKLLSAAKGGLLFDADQPAPPAPGLSQDPALERLIAIENRGQAVMLRYLKGDEIAQDRNDFLEGFQAYSEALRLAPDSVYAASRQKFFEGRLAIEDGDWQQARSLLEIAIRLDPGSPAAYNALGIGYLEQALYTEASAAFKDAIQRAPYWPYPRHNLALSYAQEGSYERAIQTYKQAMTAAPNHSYLPYNLGLLYERMNRMSDAKESLAAAREIARQRALQAKEEAGLRPGDAAYLSEAARLAGQQVPPAAALSALAGNMRNHKDEARHYEEAMALLEQYPDPRMLAIVRHNHALALTKRKDKRAEAKILWQLNIDELRYAPSRISLAEELLEQKGAPDLARAIDLYGAAVDADSANIGLRLRMANLLRSASRTREALTQLLEASRQRPESPLIGERLAQVRSELEASKDR